MGDMAALAAAAPSGRLLEDRDQRGQHHQPRGLRGGAAGPRIDRGAAADLIAGDVLAVLTYRRHAHWPTLWRLFPAVAVGW